MAFSAFHYLTLSVRCEELDAHINYLKLNVMIVYTYWNCNMKLKWTNSNVATSPIFDGLFHVIKSLIILIASFVRGYIMMLKLHEWSQEIWRYVGEVCIQCRLNAWARGAELCPGTHEHRGPMLIYVCCVLHVFLRFKHWLCFANPIDWLFAACLEYFIFFSMDSSEARKQYDEYCLSIMQTITYAQILSSHCVQRGL
jgi:hypothetical protein